jgi:protein arginine N-methyltransferase 1
MMYNELEFHAFCLTDTGSRLDQFATAIARRVKPGDIVVDLGSGSGVLSFLACRAGARRVYAVEAGESLEFARLLAARNGFQDRVEFIAKFSTQAVLPVRADVIVGDIHDTFGLQPHGLAAVVDARDRWLKPDGVLLPCAIELKTVPIEAPDLYDRTIDIWRRHVHGLDLSPMRALAVNQPTAARFDQSQLLANAASLASIDLMRLTQLHVGGTSCSEVRREGTLHGMCGCFVTTLTDGVVMGNVPGESGTTNFAQTFFPIESPVAVRAGDRIATRLETHDNAAARWQVEVTRAGTVVARFEHSTLHARSLSVQALRKQADNYRPALTDVGAVERELLDRFDGTHSAAELESWLTSRAAAVLPSAREAAAFLKQTIERCG